MLRKLKSIFQRVLDGRDAKLLFFLPNRGLVKLLDIGAAGDIEPRWKPFSSSLAYIGVEPDERSRKKLLQSTQDFHSYDLLPSVLMEDARKYEVNFCRDPQVSSILAPNFELIGRFPRPERFDVVTKEEVLATTLDELDIDDIDFIKCDIQGAELSALRGGSKLLDSVLGLEIEVEFTELYADQPLFGDLCNELKPKGFEFLDFVNLIRWERRSHNSFGQCIFGDALFIRGPEKLDVNNIDIAKVTAYLAILLVYRRFELIETTLNLLDDDIRPEFDVFAKGILKAKKVNGTVRRGVMLLNRLLGVAGRNYKLHLFE